MSDMDILHHLTGAAAEQSMELAHVEFATRGD
jgi:hypothetical protein